MDTSEPQNEIAKLRKSLGLKIEELAEKLGCQKGHASDLCTGRRRVTIPIAKKLEALSDRPWHEWVNDEIGQPEAEREPSKHGEAA